MLATQLRTPLITTTLALAAILQMPLSAQLEPERPRVALTQMPELGSDVWPADFNEDGITDLVAGQEDEALVVLLGVGDEYFAPPALAATGAGAPVGVGDLNRDGFIDVLTTTFDAVEGSLTGQLFAGHGDGTFTGPLALGFPLGTPTYVADMNNDGLPDLVSANIRNLTQPPIAGFVLLYRGHGDFTFDAVVPLRTGDALMGIVPADLNGDGFIDIAAISTFSRRIDIFRNDGDFVFAPSSLPLDRSGASIAAGDVNGDGVTDLIAGVGRMSLRTWLEGLVYVFPGRGDLTFASPATYPVNNGPVAVLVGDFNRDGLVDIATGNRSPVEACEFGIYLWDSISILPGRGDGTFGTTASFALGNSETEPDTAYRLTLNRLHASDLNADSRTDLITSPGAILLSLPPGDNSPPAAYAGPDLIEPWDPLSSPELRGSAVDADADWLTFEWKDDLGQVVGDLPRQCIRQSYGPGVTRNFTLTASDGRGGVGIDSVQWTLTGFESPPGLIPQIFSSTDIGSVGTEGFDAYKGGVLRIAGSGADIWGTTDAFRFVHTAVGGAFDVVTRVDSVENIHSWTKAGLMIREELDPHSRHAFLFVTPTIVNGVAFQRREVAAGVTVHTAGPATAPPVWLRLVREGDVITAFSRPDSASAWQILGTQTLPGLPEYVHVGPAVTSHREGALATAFFSGFSINGMPLPAPPPLPAGWQSTDVGTPAAPGHATFDGRVFSVEGSGADIWGTQDAFHYAYTTLAGDGSAIVQVSSIDGAHEWAKAGLMIRQSLDRSSVHHFLLKSRGHGTAYQRRLNAGDSTLHTALPVTSPHAAIWYGIVRSGGVIRLFYSDEFTPTSWTLIAETPFPAGDALIGMAVTSHADGQLATGQFGYADVTATGGLPPGWSTDLVGPVALPGASQFGDGVHTLSASGTDIWSTTDSFRYTYQTLAANGTIVARVTSLAAPHPWSKAGVMIRGSLDPSAPHAFMLLSRDNGLAFQRRTVGGGITTHTGGGSATPPQWLRLTRDGQLITAAVSVDGIHWTAIDSDVFEVGTGPVLVGLALTSHDDGVVATATFDNVSITP